MKKMTYKEAYQEGVRKLESVSIENCCIDARLLLEYVCKTTRNDLLVYGNREISDEKINHYFELIKERMLHVPLQYLTGIQDFMGFEFKVNENVLIPRQDTECLVEEVMRYLHDGMRILDMCTGSGCILLSLLKYSNNCEGTGVDISEKALEVAKNNKENLKVSASFLKSDLFEKVTGKFDIIVSNPPYIPTNVIPGLMEEVKNYEPYLALDGKTDGLYFYRRIVKECKEFLNGGAYIFFEIGYDQAKEVKILLEQEGFSEIRVVQDLAGLDRVVLGHR